MSKYLQNDSERIVRTPHTELAALEKKDDEERNINGTVEINRKRLLFFFFFPFRFFFFRLVFDARGISRFSPLYSIYIFFIQIKTFCTHAILAFLLVVLIHLYALHENNKMK